jgi:hypothetical protein
MRGQRLSRGRLKPWTPYQVRSGSEVGGASGVPCCSMVTPPFWPRPLGPLGTPLRGRCCPRGSPRGGQWAPLPAGWVCPTPAVSCGRKRPAEAQLGSDPQRPERGEIPAPPSGPLILFLPESATVVDTPPPKTKKFLPRIPKSHADSTGGAWSVTLINPPPPQLKFPSNQLLVPLLLPRTGVQLPFPATPRGARDTISQLLIFPSVT